LPPWCCITAAQAVPMQCHVPGKRTLKRASTSIPVLPTFALIVRHVSPRGDAHPLPSTRTPWILPADRSEALPSTVTCTGREEIRRRMHGPSAASSGIPSHDTLCLFRCTGRLSPWERRSPLSGERGKQSESLNARASGIVCRDGVSACTIRVPPSVDSATHLDLFLIHELELQAYFGHPGHHRCWVARKAEDHLRHGAPGFRASSSFAA